MRSKHKGFDSVRAKIVATASALFTRTGVHGTSLNDIAGAADIAKGTVYYYYPAKETLNADVARCHCDFMTDALLNWVEAVSREEDPRSSLPCSSRRCSATRNGAGSTRCSWRKAASTTPPFRKSC